MSYAANVSPGLYYAGLHRPFFVSRSAVESAARKAGFTAITWHERKTAPPVNPHHDPHYSDDWDEWLSATYAGKARVLELPRRPDWIIESAHHAAPSSHALPPARASTRSSSSASTSSSRADFWTTIAKLSGPFVMFGLGMLVSRRRR